MTEAIALKRAGPARRNVDRGKRALCVWIGWLALSVLLAASVAVLVNTVLFGRVPMLHLLRGWLGSLTLTSVSLCVVMWWLIYGSLLRRIAGRLSMCAAVAPAMPLILGATAPVVAIYLSDVANHYFYYSLAYANEPKALSLIVILVATAILIQSSCVEAAKGVCLRLGFERAAARLGEPFILVFLAVIGALQAAAYLTDLVNDFLRYWSIADAMSTGVGYSAVVAGSSYADAGMARYLIDLPLFPAILAASFGLFGHNVAAAYLPLVVSNIFLPPLTYLLFREVIISRVAALSLAALVVLFPPLRFYTLNWIVPDATFLAVLTAASWLFVKVAKGDQRLTTWFLFGLMSAAAVLTRPEGLAYGGTYLLAASLIRVRMGTKVATVGAFLVPVGAFSLVMVGVFGMPWPSNWTGTVALQNLVANWDVLSRLSLQIFATSIRLDPARLVIYSVLLLVLALVGSWPLLYRRRWLAALMAPAWINLLAVAMVDPRVSGAHLWLDFFRHVSYPLPFLVLAAGATVQAGIRALPGGKLQMAGLALLNLALVAGVLWNVHFLTKPSWNFGGDAGNLLDSGRVSLVDVITHPYELPLLGFQEVDGYNLPGTPAGFLAEYPSQIRDFFRPFDAVRRMAGVPYETATLYLYLAAIILALVSSRPSYEREKGQQNLVGDLSGKAGGFP